MDFGLFTTWNAVYVGDKVPWDPAYRGGKLLEASKLVDDVLLVGKFVNSSEHSLPVTQL